MGGVKTNYSIDLNQNQIDWLMAMKEKYGVTDDGKALRIVLDYVMEEAELDTVFEEVRCNHCG